MHSKIQSEAESIVLVEPFRDLLLQIEHFIDKSSDGEYVNIPESISSFSSTYEKIRNAVGYQQEQMLRRIAIERILRRRIGSNVTIEIAGTNLIKDLTDAGYLENKTVPISAVSKIGKVILKYRTLLSGARSEVIDLGLGIASAELEQLVAPNPQDEALVEAFFKSIKSYLKDQPSYSDANLLAALYRIFYKADAPMLRYQLIKYYFPDWLKAKQDDVLILKSKLNQTIAKIERILISPSRVTYNQITKKYYPLFFVIRSILKKNPKSTREILSNRTKLARNIASVTEDHHQEIVQKLNRSVIKAILFVFITKTLTGLIIEIPYDRFVLGEIHYIPLIINLLFPATLMAISASLISVPGEDNTSRLIKLAEELLYNPKSDVLARFIKKQEIYRSSNLANFLNILYIGTFVAVTAIVIWLLNIIGFNPISGLLFFVFLSTVSFLAIRIRRSVSDLRVVDESEGGAVTLIDFLLLPFVRIGHWLSLRFERANVFLFVFDFILEAPFKTILGILEQWIGFVREKKDEIIS